MRTLWVALLLLAAAGCDHISTEPDADSGLFSSTSFRYGYIPGSRD